MKSLKSLLVFIALLGAFGMAHGKTKTTLYPKVGVVVTTVHHSKVYVHKGVRFHYANGTWYRPYGKRFIVSAAPVGIRIAKLPRGRKLVYVKGRKYYRYHGVWYQKRGRGFVVVTI
ncbi:MAG: hypothetical protein KJO20_04965 [Eudoraea sp.]|nr:hypothetical protein [Eudoraea sp.]